MAKKMGAPRIEVDFNTVDKLCELHNTGEEIASFLEITYPTLLARIKEQVKPDGTNYKTFLEYFSFKSARGKISLRKMQWASANRGNIQMLIFLGKQYLGQTDKQQMSMPAETTIEVTVEGLDDDAG